MRQRLSILPALIAQLVFVAVYLSFAANTTLARTLRDNPEFSVYLRKAFETPTVLLDLLHFFLSLLLLLYIKALIAAAMALPLRTRIHRPFLRPAALVLSSLLLEIFLLQLNSRFYSFSLFGWFRYSILSSWPVLLLTASMLLGLLAVGLVRLWSMPAERRHMGVLALSVVVLATGFFIPQPPALHATATARKKPDVIILGIDSLRPDTLGIHGFSPSITPNLDQVVAQTRQFSQVITPLARTYVAWMSILSGQYPLHTGARFNLTPPEMVNRQLPLVALLKKHGYRTVFAMDERRFNNIDSSYGFDTIVGPRIGVADFLLSGISDQPAINLISNNRLARYLFPFVYNNRGQYKTYRPELFTQEVLRTSCQASEEPLFLAAHLTLPHWPFTNRGSRDLPEHLDKFDPQFPYYYLYLTMVRMADEQFGELYRGLSACGRLDNAVFVVLSDHGENFPIPSDLLQPAIPEAHFAVNSIGHGTSVTNPAQLEVVLGLQRFVGGAPLLSPETRSNLLSLVDVAPAIQTLVAKALGVPEPTTDCSLLKPCNRPVFAETSISPEGLTGSRMNALQAVMESLSIYTVADDGRVIVKPDGYDELVAAKKRAVFMGEWGLVMYPDMEGEMILYSRKQKLWWPLTRYTGSAPVKRMLNALCRFYHTDTGFDPFNNCTRLENSLDVTP